MSQTFSKTLKKLRTERGLSQQALANNMFVTRPTIARWESGTRLPDAMMIKRLAEILGVDVNFLLSAAAQSDECPNVIIVDDRKVVLSGGIKVLEEVIPNATVTGFSDTEEAIEYAKKNNIALAFLDIEIRNMSGLDLCKILLDINRKNTSGRTALVEVAVRGHTSILRILLLRETEKIIGLLNIYKNKQKMNNDDLGPYLIQDHSVNIDDEALIEAASNGLTEVVRMLLDRGADISFQDYRGQTALDYISAIKQTL